MTAILLIKADLAIFLLNHMDNLVETRQIKCTVTLKVESEFNLGSNVLETQAFCRVDSHN